MRSLALPTAEDSLVPLLRCQVSNRTDKATQCEQRPTTVDCDSSETAIMKPLLSGATSLSLVQSNNDHLDAILKQQRIQDQFVERDNAA